MGVGGAPRQPQGSGGAQDAARIAGAVTPATRRRPGPLAPSTP
jgi:hypothetical protein